MHLNPGGDEDLRELERRADAGDLVSAERIVRERKRRGLPDRTVDQLRQARADVAAMAQRNAERVPGGGRRLLLPDAVTWRDLFVAEQPTELRWEFPLPPELASSNYEIAQAWIRVNGASVGVPPEVLARLEAQEQAMLEARRQARSLRLGPVPAGRGAISIGVAHDQSEASVTEELPAPADWREPYPYTDYLAPRRGRGADRPVTRYSSIGPTCSVNGPRRYSLYVRARPEVYDVIRANSVISDRDSIFFDVVIRSNGEEPDTALVTFKNNLIIGGSWLSILPRNEIPGQ